MVKKIGSAGTIEVGWQTFRDVMLPAQLSETALDLYRSIFYGGFDAMLVVAEERPDWLRGCRLEMDAL